MPSRSAQDGLIPAGEASWPEGPKGPSAAPEAQMERRVAVVASPV
eukprot:CAMPEP_0204331672 /NCGR_PEP_ID=MMETSP0469-20131031/15883_1 /ASSEMBLY_ACC=CAM_ASM_000384 /TAXON_ID=2969 /ORGANISM="Oxyrrhis marina" /LENGTH=44 /DNA_ID= /DNA_START= /DNA_END= /DNA_ORIENTATION=